MPKQDNTEKSTELKDAVKSTVEFNRPADQELQIASESQPPAIVESQSTQALTPFQQMQQAHTMGMSVIEIKEMLLLQKDYEANEARKAFHIAMAKFKENPPQIYKDMVNKQYGSSYSSIGNTVNKVNEAMGPFGLNARWSYPKSSHKDEIIVVCILAHSMGHEEQVELNGVPDVSGSKNPLQERKSTRTYLKLETFEAVTGTASVEGNVDDDGNSACHIEYITTDQLTVLTDLIEETGSNMVQFCKVCKVEKLEQLPISKFEHANKILNDKHEAKK